MKLFRKILFPFVPLYYLVVFLRNKFYDWSIIGSKSYDFPLICVGNLSVGGTGKTPMIEYLIRLLDTKYKLATLSRGYGRKSKGFLIAVPNAMSKDIGDEPLQIFTKFKNITVAVDTDRQNGLKCLKEHNPLLEVVLLDDAFQHRRVTAGFNILLTAYNQLYCDDFVLPTGNLREPKSGAKRAQLIVVTKCPENLSELEKTQIKKRLNTESSQAVFFSTIQYSETLISSTSSRALTDLKGTRFTLVTGIANPKPLVTYLEEMGLDFVHLNYKDHHEFSTSELELIHSKPLVVTTEKDFSRLNSEAKDQLYYLPIQLKIDRVSEFDRLVGEYVKQF
ncbi:MAG: tetraacyldisaccharide 4'-kinase [Flavobacteriaceae bacterium]|jgi:tetraacyldisaccharide 4'-kinase|nr:tetraacyldisaccharide 4'-kinase [Flavobacteriaceae bacterium]